jgi:hypothetical protein
MAARPSDPVEERFAWIAERPWEEVSLPEPLEGLPTMLSREEIALLYLLARDLDLLATPGATIVDAGSFLGGSTAALTQGLLDRDPPALDCRVRTYDLFTIEYYMVRDCAWAIGDLREGDSTRARFEEILGGERLELVDVCEGDILERTWDGAPIGLLFLDIAKSWEINDHVHRQCLPALLPGAIVLQQDYVHEWSPWLHLTMELLEDAFEYLGSLPYGTAIFGSKRAIGADEVPASLREAVPDARKLELFDRSAARFAAEDRGLVELARLRLLADLGRAPEASEALEELVHEYGEHERVRAGSDVMRNWLRRRATEAPSPNPTSG